MTQRLKCIQKHVAELRLNSNIIELQLQENSQYILLTYAPPDTNAYFQNSSYHLRIDLPLDYPEQPPTVYFQDIIYHLNIHQTTGEAFMSIIKEDWSPYLTLNSVIQTISSILIEADVQFPANKAMLKQYYDQYGLYLEKMHNSVRTLQKINEKISKEALHMGVAKIGVIHPSTTQNKNTLIIQNDKCLNKMKMRRKSQNIMEILQIPKLDYEPEKSEISKLQIFIRQDDFDKKMNRSRSIYAIKSDAGTDNNFFQTNLENQISEDNYQSISPTRHVKKYEQNLKITQHLSNWKDNQLRKSKSIIPSSPAKKRQRINKSRVISKPSINTSSTKCQIAIEQQKLESIYKSIQLFISHCQKLQKQALNIQNPRLKHLIQNEIQQQTTIIEQLNKAASRSRNILMKKLAISQTQ